jgi:CHAD domain-containing protein
MYKFDPNGEPPETVFRTIALDQLNEALSDLDTPDRDGRSIVHEARRRCKKLRGLLRLVRPVFSGFARENAAIRDAAALLSHLRDAEVLHQTVADLVGWRRIDALVRIEQKLAAEHSPGAGDRLAEFRTCLEAVRTRVPSWTLGAGGAHAWLPGLRQTYRLARRRMHSAHQSRDPHDVHEWRKAAKNHGFHVDLLKRVAPDVLAEHLKLVEQLSTDLGLHHDLAVLAAALTAGPDRFGTPEDAAVLNDAIADRLHELEGAAFGLGRQLMAERPRALSDRFATYWKDSA